MNDFYCLTDIQLGGSFIQLKRIFLFFLSKFIYTNSVIRNV